MYIDYTNKSCILFISANLRLHPLKKYSKINVSYSAIHPVILRFFSTYFKVVLNVLDLKKKNKHPSKTQLPSDRFIHSLIDHFLLLHITLTSKCEIQTSTLTKLSHGSTLLPPITDEHVTL